MMNKLYLIWVWLGVTFILVWSPLARGAVPKRLWSITPVLMIITALGFLWLLLRNNRSAAENENAYPISKDLSMTGTDCAIFAFLSLAAFSIVFSVYKYAGFLSFVVLLNYVILYYVLSANYSEAFRNYLISAVVCIASALSVYGLLQHFGVFSHAWWLPKGLLASTFVNHNHFAGYLELAIPLSIGALLSIRHHRSRFKPALVLAIAIMTTAFIFAQSRGAWISLAISLFVMSVVLIKRNILRKKTVIMMSFIALVILLGIYLAGGVVSERMESIPGIFSGEASTETRVSIWKGTLKMIADDPITGTGIGTFVWGFPYYGPVELARMRPHYAHNDYLHMVAEMGLFAPVLVLLILASIIGTGFRGCRGGNDTDMIMLGCATGILSLSIHGLVDFNFHIPANMILLILCAAIIRGESARA
jgi:O-antigen ligase